MGGSAYAYTFLPQTMEESSPQPFRGVTGPPLPAPTYIPLPALPHTLPIYLENTCMFVFIATVTAAVPLVVSATKTICELAKCVLTVNATIAAIKARDKAPRAAEEAQREEEAAHREAEEAR